MSLDYSGIPEFNRDRNIFTASVGKNQFNDFISKEIPSTTPEDELFDETVKTFLKGEALKEAIALMDPAGFIPVEEESLVIRSIQRLFPDEPPGRITFGMFKEACDYIAASSMNVDENWILTYNVIDPKLENIKTVSKHKNISSSGKDWISAFLEQLSPFAGLLIAGALNDLYFAIAPQIDVDSQGGTGGFKSWAAQGAPVAIAILVEIGFTIAEFNRLYKDSNIPHEVTAKIEELIYDQKKRRQVLEDAGFDYEKMRENQRYNDYDAIRNYSFTYIQRHQDNLNYHHWVSYSQVSESQIFTRSAASMAPTFSDKWRKLYKIGDSSSSQSTTITEDIKKDELSSATSYVKTALNTGLTGYIKSMNAQLNESYNAIYQSLSFEIDPCLICCLVSLFGKIDTSVLKMISTLLKLSAQSFFFSLADLLTVLIKSLVVGILNMIISYLSQIIDHLIRKITETLSNSLPLFDDARWRCLGIPPIMFSIDIGINYVFEIFTDIIKNLQMLVARLQTKQIGFAETSASSKVIIQMAAMIDKLANRIDSAQVLCSIESAIDDATAETLVSISADMDKLYPVLKMAEEEKRKHFANLPSIELEYMGVEIPGTDANGNKQYSKPIPNCFDNETYEVNLAIGAKLGDQIKL